jgi:hypothetical protein
VGLTIRGARLFAAALTFALIVALAVPAEAARRTKTRFDGIRDCERTGSAQFLRHNPTFKRFLIDRANVEVDKYVDRVGSQFVSSIYHGKATYEAAAGARPTRFICLHGGMGRRAVFVYTLPD